MFQRLRLSMATRRRSRAHRRIPGIAVVSLCLVASAASAGADPATCAPPAALGDDWQLGSAADVQVDATALCSVLRGVSERPDNIHALLIARRGRLIAELYRSGPDRSMYSLFARDRKFGPGDRHDLRSISKSVVGLLVGIAVQRGVLSLASPVLDFYPEYPDLRDQEHDRITLEHLLTMSSGLAWRESVATYGGFANDETRLFWDLSPAHYVLSRPIAAPAGRQFNYNGGGTTVVADVVTRSAKVPLREFARTSLFEPLGITDWEWVGDLYGRPAAFAGLRLKPRDLLKIGRMMLDNGRWHGRQIVPPEWVAQSLRPHIATGSGLGYGYFWWTGNVPWQGTQVPWGAAFGNGGQRLFVVPTLDLTVAMTAGAYNDARIAATAMGIFEQVVAAVQPRQPTDADAAR